MKKAIILSLTLVAVILSISITPAFAAQMDVRIDPTMQTSTAEIKYQRTVFIEYENGATLAFHTNMRVPDEFRRFAIIGTKGMVEGDFVRGYLTAHNSHTGKKIFDENFGAAFQQGTKGHYGADQLMLSDINSYLIKNSKELKFIKEKAGKPKAK